MYVRLGASATALVEAVEASVSQIDLSTLDAVVSVLEEALAQFVCNIFIFFCFLNICQYLADFN